MSVLVITGSARRDSYTRRLGEALAAGLPDAVLAPRLTDLPYFDQDLEAAPPASVEALRAQVRAADAVVVVTPEYNGTVSGLLGNAVDWLSRPYGAGSLRDKPVVAVAASPGCSTPVRSTRSSSRSPRPSTWCPRPRISPPEPSRRPARHCCTSPLPVAAIMQS